MPPGGAGQESHHISRMIYSLMMNRYIIPGLLLMGVSKTFYLLLLYFSDFTRALPVMGVIAYILIPLYGIFFLKETLSLCQIGGLILLVAGILLMRH